MIRVLVVDDNDSILRALSVILESQTDIEVVGLARDGLMTLERAETLMPDVVIMDVEMPIMNGVEATRHIKRLFPSMGVLLLSGAEKYREASVDAGADDYLTKPFDNEALFSKVRDIAARD